MELQIDDILEHVERTLYRAMAPRLSRYSQKPPGFLYQGTIKTVINTAAWTFENMGLVLTQWLLEMKRILDTLVGVTPPLSVQVPSYDALLEYFTLRRATHIYVCLDYSPEKRLLACSVALISLSAMEIACAA